MKDTESFCILHAFPDVRNFQKSQQMDVEFPHAAICTTPVGKSLKSVNPKHALEHWGVWFEQALEALSWLHAQGYTHGFLDPASLRVEDNCLKLWIRKTETTTFDPKHSIYPPEILLKLAFEDGLSLSTAYDLLESRNPSLELCESQLDLDYSFRTFQILWKHLDIQDAYKADVWMLGNSFLKLYLEFLTWPGSIATVFYRHDHERFMNCLGRMLEAHPTKRLSAEAAFHTWSPPLVLYPTDMEDEQTGVTAESEQLADSEANAGINATESAASELITNTISVVSDDASAASTAAPMTTESVDATPVVVSASEVAPKPRRLVLNGYHDPAARNKTRRNPHNSNPIPAIRSRGTRTRG